MSDDQNSTNLPSPPNAQGGRVSTGWQQLNLVLGFFSRIDTKLSVVLGIDLGMLALVATRLPPPSEMTAAAAVFTTLFFTALGFSFRHLWNGSFPHLDGGTASLLYFRSIAQMRESEFRQACKSRSPEELADDLFNQCWRNSKILTCKFHSLRQAYIATLLAVVPWAALIILLPSPQRPG